jgi:hypothetical protein
LTSPSFEIKACRDTLWTGCAGWLTRTCPAALDMGEDGLVEAGNVPDEEPIAAPASAGRVDTPLRFTVPGAARSRWPPTIDELAASSV